MTTTMIEADIQNATGTEPGTVMKRVQIDIVIGVAIAMVETVATVTGKGTGVMTVIMNRMKGTYKNCSVIMIMGKDKGPGDATQGTGRGEGPGKDLEWDLTAGQGRGQLISLLPGQDRKVRQVDKGEEPTGSLAGGGGGGDVLEGRLKDLRREIKKILPQGEANLWIARGAIQWMCQGHLSVLWKGLPEIQVPMNSQDQELSHGHALGLETVCSQIVHQFQGQGHEKYLSQDRFWVQELQSAQGQDL